VLVIYSGASFENMLMYLLLASLLLMGIQIYLRGSNFLINWIANSSLYYFLYKRQVAQFHAKNSSDKAHSFTTNLLGKTAVVIAIPFLHDNYAYILMEKASGECAMVDAADPETHIKIYFNHTQTL